LVYAVAPKIGHVLHGAIRNACRYMQLYAPSAAKRVAITFTCNNFVSKVCMSASICLPAYHVYSRGFLVFFTFLDQELIPYSYSSCTVNLFVNIKAAQHDRNQYGKITQHFLFLFFLLGLSSSKRLRLHRFKSDRGEIWQDYSPSEYASSINGVGIL